jgi:hypothetical protein
LLLLTGHSGGVCSLYGSLLVNVVQCLLFGSILFKMHVPAFKASLTLHSQHCARTPRADCLPCANARGLLPTSPDLLATPTRITNPRFTWTSPTIRNGRPTRSGTSRHSMGRRPSRAQQDHGRHEHPIRISPLPRRRGREGSSSRGFFRRPPQQISMCIVQRLRCSGLHHARA